MKYNDSLYRALKSYRAETTSNECRVRREQIVSAKGESDIEVTTYDCTIEQDWIDEIEKGLVYVEKAIDEERQFIRSNGEILPIEKVKRVSRESVEYLAKHSESLTKEPPAGGDIIPDEVYVVEKLSDYALYENRFLYMLLCYLRDFIAIRYNKIIELTETYSGKVRAKRTVIGGSRILEYEIELSEEIKRDEYLRELNPIKEQIDKIELLSEVVASYMKRPLIERVAKEPMLRPPITKTNILRMDNNFKQAVALYEYVSSYQGPGYTIEKRDRKVALTKEARDEFCEIPLELAFLAHERGLDIEPVLKREYEEEEERRRLEEQRALLGKIEALRRKVKESGEGWEEYVLSVESRNRFLEKLPEKLEELTEDCNAKREKIKELYISLAEMTDKLDFFNKEKTEEIEKINSAFAKKEAELKEEIEKAELLAKRERETLNAQFDEEKRAFEEEIEKGEIKYAELEKSSAENAAACDAEITSLKKDKAALEKENFELKAILFAKSLAEGKTPSEDYSERENFDRLEDYYDAFTQYFEKNWKDAKKKIRKNVLWKSLQKERKTRKDEASAVSGAADNATERSASAEEDIKVTEGAEDNVEQ